MKSQTWHVTRQAEDYWILKPETLRMKNKTVALMCFQLCKSPVHPTSVTGSMFKTCLWLKPTDWLVILCLEPCNSLIAEPFISVLPYPILILRCRVFSSKLCWFYPLLVSAFSCRRAASRKALSQWSFAMSLGCSWWRAILGSNDLIPVRQGLVTVGCHRCYLFKRDWGVG